jgi:hypothetical protein
MLCKWISAGVPASAHAKFAEAQRQWLTIEDQPGLIGQVGGWDNAAGTAHVLALWNDRDSYQSFMVHRHDAVTAARPQESIYTSIETAVGDVIFSMQARRLLRAARPTPLSRGNVLVRRGSTPAIRRRRCASAACTGQLGR